jgi:NAD(P)-dependent dehydrogenase (short-subunit alcohol dehydrogenase family)
VSARFDGRGVLVTGAGTGIGRVAALAFAREGAKVALVGRRVEKLLEAGAELGDRALVIPADIAQPGQPAAVVAKTLAAFGRIDVLVNNAGHFFRKTLAETTDADLAQAYRTNVIAPLELAREALSALRATRGCIVNVTSTAARVSKPTLSAYSSSKRALEQATKSLAVELGPDGIRVNAVAPGMTDTDMIADLAADAERLRSYVASTPLARVGRPDDVVSTILFLASEDAAWVTGQVVQASGGFQL